MKGYSNKHVPNCVITCKHFLLQVVFQFQQFGKQVRRGKRFIGILELMIIRRFNQRNIFSAQTTWKTIFLVEIKYHVFQWIKICENNYVIISHNNEKDK